MQKAQASQREVSQTAWAKTRLTLRRAKLLPRFTRAKVASELSAFLARNTSCSARSLSQSKPQVLGTIALTAQATRARRDRSHSERQERNFYKSRKKSGGIKKGSRNQSSGKKRVTLTSHPNSSSRAKFKQRNKSHFSSDDLSN